MNLKASFLVLAFALPFGAHAKMNTELSKYYKLTQKMSEQLVILKDAGKCGNIGSRVADSMDKGLNDLQKQKQEVAAATKKGQAGKPVLEEVVSTAEKDFHKIDSHKGMVLWGLDGDEPACVTATKAFTTLHDVTAQIPDQLRKVSASL